MLVLAAPRHAGELSIISAATLVEHSFADRTYNLIQPLALVYFSGYASTSIYPITYHGSDDVHLGRLMHITSVEEDDEELLRLDLNTQRAYINLPPGTLVGGKTLNHDAVYFDLGRCLFGIKYNSQFRNHLPIAVNLRLDESTCPEGISIFSREFSQLAELGVLENKLMNLMMHASYAKYNLHYLAAANVF